MGFGTSVRVNVEKGFVASVDVSYPTCNLHVRDTQTPVHWVAHHDEWEGIRNSYLPQCANIIKGNQRQILFWGKGDCRLEVKYELAFPN